jgi:hypothetical protein
MNTSQTSSNTEYMNYAIGIQHYAEKKYSSQGCRLPIDCRTLIKMVADNILRRCVLEHERPMILEEAHEGITGGHYAGKDTAHKLLRTGLWWPTIHRDSKD